MESLSVEITAALKKGKYGVRNHYGRDRKKNRRQHSAECESIGPPQILDAMHF